MLPARIANRIDEALVQAEAAGFAFLEGIEIMARRRGLPAGRRELTNGPGKLCQAFGIDARLYGADLTRRVLYLAEGPSAKVARSRRIGIDYAGAWADKPWRFYDPDSRFVSPVRVQR